jgi:hypothetical protein
VQSTPPQAKNYVGNRGKVLINEVPVNVKYYFTHSDFATIQALPTHLSLESANRGTEQFVMSQKKRLAYTLAVVGFGIAATLFAYLEMTDYKPFQSTMITVSLVLCPASALSAAFLDIEPHSAEAVLGWLVIAVINGALYGIVGYAVGKYVWKST